MLCFATDNRPTLPGVDDSVYFSTANHQYHDDAEDFLYSEVLSQYGDVLVSFDRPFPTYPVPLFQIKRGFAQNLPHESELIYSHGNEKHVGGTHFYMNGFAQTCFDTEVKWYWEMAHCKYIQWSNGVLEICEPASQRASEPCEPRSESCQGASHSQNIKNFHLL